VGGHPQLVRLRTIPMASKMVFSIPTRGFGFVLKPFELLLQFEILHPQTVNLMPKVVSGHFHKVTRLKDAQSYNPKCCHLDLSPEPGDLDGQKFPSCEY
jgi:hypothetical protein